MRLAEIIVNAEVPQKLIYWKGCSKA